MKLECNMELIFLEYSVALMKVKLLSYLMGFKRNRKKQMQLKSNWH